MDQNPSRRTILAGLAAIAAAQRHARAAEADSFYRGKRLTLIVGFAPGGGVDTDSRIISRHLPRFLPGAPSILVQNMEGAAGIIAANYLSRVAPDGLTIAIPGRSWFVEGAIGTGGTRFDPAKFTYIGSPGAVNSVVYVRSATGIRTFDELKSAKKPVVFGALGNLTPTA